MTDPLGLHAIQRLSALWQKLAKQQEQEMDDTERELLLMLIEHELGDWVMRTLHEEPRPAHLN
jgi:hypothetical protein